MKKFKFLTAAAALTLMLAACGDEETTKSEETSKTEQAETSTEAVTAFPMTVKSLSEKGQSRDGSDPVLFEDVVLEEVPKNVVVLDFGFLDTLDALGVEGIKGVPLNGNDGRLSQHLVDKYMGNKDVTDVGSVQQVNFEAVATVNPDVIFISGRQISDYEALKEITPNVIYVASSNEDYVDGLFESVDLAAQIFGKEDKAEELKNEFLATQEKLKEKAAGYENALVTLYSDKKISGFDNSEGSRYKYVYDDFGFKSVASGIKTGQHGSNFSYESILEVNPEVLLVIDRGTTDEAVLKADIENDIIKKTKAYQNNRIVYLSGITWYYGAGGITTERAKMEEILNELN